MRKGFLALETGRDFSFTLGFVPDARATHFDRAVLMKKPAIGYFTLFGIALIIGLAIYIYFD